MAKLLIHIHALAVLLSLTGFVLRGIWMLRDSPRLKARWVKITPHVIDTILLLSALGAAWLLFWRQGAYPTFINIKIVGLIGYIALGLFALKLGKTKAIRASAWVLAIILFLYVATIGIAHTHPGLIAPSSVLGGGA